MCYCSTTTLFVAGKDRLWSRNMCLHTGFIFHFFRPSCLRGTRLVAGKSSFVKVIALHGPPCSPASLRHHLNVFRRVRGAKHNSWKINAIIFLPQCFLCISTPVFFCLYAILFDQPHHHHLAGFECFWRKRRRQDDKSLGGVWGSKALLLMTLISHFYDSYITGNKKALICNWIPPCASRRAHAHTRARKHTLCNLAYCNNKKESYYGFPLYIHSVNLVKLADGKPVPVHVLEALCYITTNVHMRFSCMAQVTRRRMLERRKVEWALMISQIRELESEAYDILSKREWGFVVESKASFNGEISRVPSIKEGLRLGGRGVLICLVVEFDPV